MKIPKDKSIFTGDKDLGKIAFLAVTVGMGVYASYLVFKTIALKVAKSV